MSLHFISGRPGAGKSLYGLRLILDELLHGVRPVVTNLPVNKARLNEYIQETWPEKTVDVLNRVEVMTDEQTKAFYLCRPGNAVREIPDVKGHHKTDTPLVFETDGEGRIKGGGVLFVLDEVHLFFNARRWMETGRAVTFYLSQHRKLGDDVLAISQHVDKVDKQFRLDGQDFTFIRNLGKEKAWFFRLPGGFFTRSTYMEPHQGPGNKPMVTASFTLDAKGLASCYDTTAGVGVMGREADRNERKTGWSLAWGLIPLALVVFLIFKAPGWIKGAMGAVVKGGDKAIQAAHGAAMGTNAAVTNAAARTERKAEGARAVATVEPLPGVLAVAGEETVSAFWNGRVLVGGKWLVPDRVFEEGCLAGGRWFEWKPRTVATNEAHNTSTTERAQSAPVIDVTRPTQYKVDWLRPGHPADRF